MNLDKAAQKSRNKLLKKAGVTGVWTGTKETGGRDTGRPCIKVAVQKKRPLAEIAKQDVVPPKMRGWETDVIEQEFVALGRKDRWRPPYAGISVGHPDITAGTLGCPVRIPERANLAMLSNNHVIAASNEAELGDSIVQPGPADGGKTPNDVVGQLLAYVPIHWDGDDAPAPDDECRVAIAIANAMLAINRAVASSIEAFNRRIGSRSRFEYSFRAVDAPEPNRVDAAVASADDLRRHILDEDGEPTILPSAFGDARSGDEVEKSGRTTGYTKGTVEAVDGTVRVNYGEGKTATFEDVIVIRGEGFSAGGDSGSAILLRHGQHATVVGLLFAGGGGYTIACKAKHLQDALGVSL